MAYRVKKEAPPWPHTNPVRVTVCCAKCRRGIKAFGLLPCGYDLKCPNKCHEKQWSENK